MSSRETRGTTLARRRAAQAELRQEQELGAATLRARGSRTERTESKAKRMLAAGAAGQRVESPDQAARERTPRLGGASRARLGVLTGSAGKRALSPISIGSARAAVVEDVEESEAESGGSLSEHEELLSEHSEDTSSLTGSLPVEPDEEDLSSGDDEPSRLHEGAVMVDLLPGSAVRTQRSRRVEAKSRTVPGRKSQRDAVERKLQERHVKQRTVSHQRSRPVSSRSREKVTTRRWLSTSRSRSSSASPSRSRKPVQTRHIRKDASEASDSQLFTSFTRRCPAALTEMQLQNTEVVAAWLLKSERTYEKFFGWINDFVMETHFMSLLPDSVTSQMSEDMTVPDILQDVRDAFCPDDPVRYIVQRLKKLTTRQPGTAVGRYVRALREVFRSLDDAGCPVAARVQLQLCRDGLQFQELDLALAGIVCDTLAELEQALHMTTLKELCAKDPLMQTAGQRRSFKDGQRGQQKSAAGRSTSGDAESKTTSAGTAASNASGGATVTCHNCKKVGHFARSCPMRSTAQSSQAQRSSKDSSGAVAKGVVTAIRGPVGLGSARYIWLSVAASDAPDAACAKVKALVDTGAERTVIPSSTLQQLSLDVSVAPDADTLVAYGDHQLSTVGTVRLYFPVFSCQRPVHVVHGELGPIVLGRDIGSTMFVSDDEVVVNGVSFLPEDRDGDVIRPAIVHAVQMVVEASRSSQISPELDALLDLPSQRLEVGPAEPAPSMTEEERQQAWLHVPVMDVEAVRRLCWDLCVESRESDVLPALETAPVRIPLRPDASPVVCRQRFTHPVSENAVESEVQELLRRGILEPAHSPWRSRVVLVPKPDGGVRPVVDYRALNAACVPQAFPMPVVNDVLARLTGAAYMCKLDAKTGYWQLPLAEESRACTAIGSKSGSYQHTRLPMGVACAPAVFQKFMIDLLSGCDHCEVYIDDIVVYGQDWPSFCAAMAKVTQRIRASKLVLNGKKSIFCSERLNVLGHVVSKQGVAADPEKVRAVVDVPAPANKSELRSFLGAAGYYRRFIDGFASKVAPLTALLAADTPFVWSAEQQQAFEVLKNALVSMVALAHPDFNKEFIVRTDASKAGIGAVLAQRDDSGALRPIAFYSRKFTPAEARYTTREQELLGVVCSIKHWQEYLLPREFCLMTDHQNLTYLWKNGEVDGRLGRWLLTVQMFSFRLVHVAGKSLGDADMLSRLMALRRVTGPRIDVPSLEEIAAAQQDPKAVLFLEQKCSHVSLIRKDGVVYTSVSGRLVPVIPPGDLRVRLITAAHVLHAHPGVQSTVRRLRRSAYWPGMTSDVKTFVGACVSCMKTSAQPKARGFMGAIPVTAPWQTVAVDIVGPLHVVNGLKYILSIQDRFSRFCVLVALRRATAQAVADAVMDHWVCMYGVPVSILSDRGQNFVGEVFSLLAARLGVTRLRTSSYHPESNGGIERLHRSLAQLMRHLDGESSWPMQLPYVAMLLNSSPCESTGMSPNMVLFGREVNLPLDMLALSLDTVEQDRKKGVSAPAAMQAAWKTVLAASEQAHLKNKTRVDSKRQDVPELGPFVFVFEVVRQKFGKKWTGPYKLVRMNSSKLSAIVEHVQTGRKRTVHVNRLRTAPMHALDDVDMVDEDLSKDEYVIDDEVSASCNVCGDRLSESMLDVIKCSVCGLQYHERCAALSEHNVDLQRWVCRRCIDPVDRSDDELDN